MAKAYINTVKYEIKMKFEIEGIVDKPDIIGAIFGQSEGLLGDEMDLKELQKNGKVGRIEINHTTSMGRTKGEVIVPSSMDMAETSILAAGIESVDKVGPCGAKFEISDISDTRSSKRDEIKDRAKELLKRMMENSKPEVQSLSEEIKENARAADITEYGPDKLPAGPDVDSSEEVIVVEGRADVLNLLRNQIRNVIGMNGSNISGTIVKLSREKQILAFIDGDRGGLLNARKLCQIARVAAISKAPDGKEVEELTRKEILQSLKRKLSPRDAFTEDGRKFEHTAPAAPGMEKPYEGHGFEREGAAQNFRERPFERMDRPQRPPMGADMENGMPPQRHEHAEHEGGANRQFGGGRFGGGERPMRGGPRGEFRGRGPPMRGGMGMRTGDRPRFPGPSFGEAPGAGGLEGFGERPGNARMAFNPNDDSGPAMAPSAMLTSDEEAAYKPVLTELKGSMKARILDEKNELVKEVKVKDIVAEIAKTKKAHAVVLDGVVTKRLVDAAQKAGVKFVVGARKGKIEENKDVKAAAL